MSQFLFESPVTIGVTGAAITLIAAITWVKGGFPAALYSALALFVLTILLLILNLQIQTDRERVEGVMHEVARAVQQNDFDGVLSHIHPSRAAAFSRTKSQLSRCEFTEARITAIKKIEVNADTNPPSAIAEFNAYAAVTVQGTPHKAPQFVRCYFLHEGGRWLVSDYELHEPTYGFKIESEQ